MKRKQLRPLQQSMVQIMGHKLTGNLKKTLKEAMNIELVDAWAAVVMHCGEFKGAKILRFLAHEPKHVLEGII